MKEITSSIRGKKTRPTNQTQKRRWLKILPNINPDGDYWHYLLDQAKTYSFSFGEFLDKAEDNGLFQYWLNGGTKEKTPPTPTAVKFHSNGHNGNGVSNGTFKCSDYYRWVEGGYELGVMINGVWDTSPEYWWKDGKYTDFAWKYDDYRKEGEPPLKVYGDIKELMGVK